MTDAPPTGKDETLKGILLAFAAFAAFSFSDASVKLIKGALPPFEFGVFRRAVRFAGVSLGAQAG